MEAEVLKTENLTKKYGSFTALDNASVKVNRGDVYGLIGKNGAGKTTLFKLIMGLSERTDGKIEIDGSSNLNESRSKIGFMIGTSFFPYLNANDNIEYYRKLKGISDKGETERVLKLVELYGEKKPAKSYSMGMKQRLGIANALLGNRPIIILDEPINGLDPQGIADIRNMIKQINEKDGTTFIISSHILSELDLVATKFGFIDKGVLLREISHEDLHNMTGKALIIEVDNTERALDILDAKLNIKQFSKIHGKEIILESHLDEAEQISKLLVENGIGLKQIKKHETTLEQYFINLVGGVE